MKLYVMSRTRNNGIVTEILTPKVSRDFKNLSVEMTAEYEKVLKDAGGLGKGYVHGKGEELVVYYGACKHTWRIDEVKC